ncbi:MAG: EVE domain-containing protein, partial [Sandaracinaceae bacterium]|nr:EVE domain-containing protein [Sandaracinaceae bacterium]
HGFAPPDSNELARSLHFLDPSLGDPLPLIRSVPTLDRTGWRLLQTVIRGIGQEIEAHFEDEMRRMQHFAPSTAGPHVQNPSTSNLPGFGRLIGRSPQMRAVFDLIRKVAPSDATVIITGETGTGKELVARTIHEHSRRKHGPFVAQNCAAIPPELLESTLFGHVRGAFSGAFNASEGLFGAAQGGTLFLDEIGELPLSVQTKLLRVLADGSYYAVGSTRPRRSNARVLVATHRDLREMVARGEFRSDLYYRLNVITIELPPLRKRVGDLRLLIEWFLAQQVEAPRRISNTAMRCLEKYDWPGNVRELASEVARWGIVARGAPEVGPEHLSPPIQEAGGYGRGGDDAVRNACTGQGTLDEAIASLERAILERGLERTQGNLSRLARELGVSRTTLYERLKRYGLEKKWGIPQHNQSMSKQPTSDQNTLSNAAFPTIQSTGVKRYWLMKSEPSLYSIDDLERDRTTMWEGVRNHQAKAFLAEMQVGDLALFYHSNTDPPGVAGICEIVRTAYPDPTQFDPKSRYFDPQSRPEKPRWLCVDVRFVERFKHFVSLEELRKEKALEGMLILRKGNRLSVTPVDPIHFAHIQKMGDQ